MNKQVTKDLIDSSNLKPNEKIELFEKLDHDIENLTNNSSLKSKEKIEIIEKLDAEDSSYPSNPGNISTSIKGTGEAAFQRALLLSEANIFYYKDTLFTVEWLDGELPVVFNPSSRRHSVDLIGEIIKEYQNVSDNTKCKKSISDKDLVFVELKYASPDSLAVSNSPEYAILQLLVYYYHILKNRTSFKPGYGHKNGQSIDWTKINFKNNKLFVLANCQYWNNANATLLLADAKRTQADIQAKLGKKIFMFTTEDEDYKTQKGASLNYTPNINKPVIWFEV